MITVKSSFKISEVMPVYKSVLRRNIGTMIFYWVLTFVFLPLQYIFELTNYWQRNMYPLPDWNLYGPAQIFNGISVVFFTAIALVAPMMITVALFSYMHNKRSVDVYHSLPLTRDELYMIHSAVAVTVVFIPLLVNFSIVAIASLASPVKNVGDIMLEMLCWMAISFVIIAVTALTAVNSGTSFDTAIFSVGLNISLPAIYFTVLMLGQLMLYGFSMNDEYVMTGCKLSPFSVIVLRQGIESSGIENLKMLSENNIAVLLWLLIGTAILIIGLLSYRKRPSENAEMVGNMGPIQVYLRSAGTLAAGTLLGFMFCGVFDYESDTAVLIASFAASILVYFVGDALLSRNIRALPKALPKAVITASGVAVVVLVMMFGGLGYESRVPAIDSVENVTLRYYRGRFDSQPRINYSYGRGIDLESEQAVRLILSAHDAQCRAEHETDTETYYSADLDIEYHLSNGKTMRRSYNGVCADTYELLFALDTDPEFVSKNHPIFSIEPQQINTAALYNTSGTDEKTLNLTDLQKAELAEALRADLLAQPISKDGKKGIGYLNLEIKYLPRDYHTGEIVYSSVVVTEENVIAVEAGTNNAVEVTTEEAFPDSERRTVTLPGIVASEEDYRYSTSETLLTEDFTNTIALLRKFGAGDILENDFSKVKGAYIGIPVWQIDGMGNAVNQTCHSDIFSIDEDVFFNSREYGVTDTERGYTHITAEQLKAAEDKLMNLIVPYSDRYVVVGVVTEDKKGNDMISGCYFAPISAFDEDTVALLLENSVECYGRRMIERLGYIAD